MINASAEFIELCQGHGRKWQKILSNEREHRQRLEDMVEQLAKQHSHLENMVRKEIEHHDSEINATNNRYNFRQINHLLCQNVENLLNTLFSTFRLKN